MSREKRVPTEKTRPILDRIEEGLALPRCRACGCLHKALEAFEKALIDTPGAEAGELRDKLLAEAARLEAEAYDCLGCETCLGAEAIVLCTELFGGGAFDAAGALDQPSATPEAAPGCG